MENNQYKTAFIPDMLKTYKKKWQKIQQIQFRIESLSSE